MHHNLWSATAPPSPALTPLTGDATTDALVIGGGYTGLSAALHLAQAGRQVLLLEGHDIGHGGSGRNVGLVNAGLWTPPDEIVARLGAQTGERLIAALGAAPDLVFELIRRHDIACEATRVGTLHLAHSAHGQRSLQERCRQWQARGAPVTLLGRDATADLTGLRGHVGSLHDARAGTIQPLAYARGLATAALAAGARLHVDSPVTALAPDSGVWRARTLHGTVHAGQVVLATNAYSEQWLPALRAELPAAYTPVHYFQFATEPLPPSWHARVLPQGHGTWDTRSVMISLRRDAQWRLLVGSVGDLGGMRLPLLRRWARRTLATLLPGLPTPILTHAWSGRIAFTPDHLPRLAELAPGLLAVTGYNGRGIGPGTVFGKALADALLGAPAQTLPLPFAPMAPVAWRRWRALAYESGAAISHLA